MFNVYMYMYNVYMYMYRACRIQAHSRADRSHSTLSRTLWVLPARPTCSRCARCVYIYTHSFAYTHTLCIRKIRVCIHTFIQKPCRSL